MVNVFLSTSEGFNNLLNSTYFATSDPPTKHNYGIGTATPSETNTSLGKRIPLTATIIDDCESITGWITGPNNAVSVNTTNFRVGNAAINIYKTASPQIILLAQRTYTTPQDFTDKDFWIWVYVADISIYSSANLLYGSDSSNYYRYELLPNNIVNGWNAVFFNTTSATETVGTPVITSMDFVLLAFVLTSANTAVPEGDLIIDDIKLATPSDYDIAFGATYPQINLIDNSVTFQSRLELDEGVGYAISEIGQLSTNNDLYTHSVTDPDNKTFSEIFVVREKIKLINTNL